MEDADSFYVDVCDSKTRSISKNIDLTFPITAFFELLLRECLEDSTIRITSYNLIPNSNETMYLPATSIIKRYVLKGERDGDHDFQKYIIVKIRNEDPQYNKHGVRILHENEILAYSEILTLLNQEEFCSGPLPIPKVYFAFKNLIVMEDLNQESFYFPKKYFKGISTYQCRLILKQLAKFHSCSLVCQIKEPKKFEELKNVLRENLFCYKQSKILEYKSLFFKKLLAFLEMQQRYTPELENAIKTLKHIQETFVKQIKNLILYPKEHSVFCHGDLRASNILIHDDTGEVKFIDFQQMCYSSIARDIITLFYINLQPRDMSYFMNNFLMCYLKQLHIHLKEQGVDLESELTEDWLHNEMMRFQVYGIVCGLWHSVEFYIDNIGSETSIEVICSEKYSPLINIRSDFAERAAAMLTFYENQNPSAVLDQ